MKRPSAGRRSPGGGKGTKLARSQSVMWSQIPGTISIRNSVDRGRALCLFSQAPTEFGEHSPLSGWNVGPVSTVDWEILLEGSASIILRESGAQTVCREVS